MDRSAFITTEKKHEYPILIVDKQGVIGEELAKQLKSESLVVFVSRKYQEPLDNVVHVPFLKKFPTIPDNTYSHIFLIDEDLEIAKNVIESFVKKAKNDNSFLIFATNLNAGAAPIINNLVSSYEKAKISIFGDIFKKDSIYNPNTDINKFIAQIKSANRIDIPGDGTRETSPVYFEDVVSGILETVFGAGEKNQVFYIFTKHKITLLRLAHMFQKVEPDLKLDFVKDTSQNQSDFIPSAEGIYILGDTYDIEQRLKKIEFENLQTENFSRPLPKFKEKRDFGFSIPFLFIFFAFFLLLPLISTVTFALIGANSLYAVKSDIEKGNFSSSKSLAVVASRSFDIALSSSSVLYEEARLIGQQDRVTDLTKKIEFGSRISNAAASVIDASEKIKSVVSGTSNKSSTDFSQASVELKSALAVYNKEKEAGLIPSSISEKFSDIINIFSATVDFWPDMAGFNGEKNYLVLFQNNMELRPGGGFIGSYAILTVDKGKVQGFKIYDVYDADGQLTGHVEPPYPIRRYLPSVHWYLRDSNFNIDFSRGAVASAVFLDSEMHQAVDGVIAVDLSFVKNLLSIVGPVKVPDYNTTVDTDNFYPVIQTNVEKDFFPGSTQKKDFLKSFYNALQLKISENKNISYLGLIQVLATSIYEKHVLFAFNDVNQQAIFAVNGWSSSLIDERSNDDNRVNDFLGISESNLGVDKVNYFITRSVSQNATIAANGSVSENLTIAFKNTANKNEWTGALYKNYLRIILPSGTSIASIKINNVEQKIVPAITNPAVYEKKDFKAPEGLEVQKDDQGKNTIYGFLINLQPQELMTIQVKYNLLKKINLSRSDMIYSLKLFKQPGVDQYPYDFSLNLPSNIKVVDSNDSVKTDKTKTVLSTQITRDREVLINLAPK